MVPVQTNLLPTAPLLKMAAAASLGWFCLKGQTGHDQQLLPRSTECPMSAPRRTHRLEIRVAYNETDGQRRVHHGVYLNYFERGRVELLRSSGQSYKLLEQSGLMLVVSEIYVRYFHPAEFDDLLQLETTVVSSRGARIVHTYQITRGDTPIADGESTIACVGPAGRVARLPRSLQIPS